MEKLRPFRFWCQKVLPLVYDDSLSYYEVLQKITYKLNEIITTINESIRGTTHYYTKRDWVHITSNEEWEKYLQMFNEGETSKNAYIDAAGVYKLEDYDSIQGFPVFNCVQMHIVATVPGVKIDLNGATLYNTHFVLTGSGGRITVIDTNNVDRQEYFEGGQAFFKYCDFYCSTRFWYSHANFLECVWYDLNSWSGVCVDALGSRVLLDYCSFLVGDSENSPNYSLFGLGCDGTITTYRRLTIKNPSGNNTVRFLTKRQDGNGRIYLYSSCFNPETNKSYMSSEEGNFTEFSNMNNLILGIRYDSGNNHFKYLTPTPPVLENTLIQVIPENTDFSNY